MKMPLSDWQMGNDPKQCTFYPMYWVTPIRMSSLDINNESIRANFFFASNHKKEYKKKNGKSKEKKKRSQTWNRR